ncbi:MAG: hypothetical protein HQM16_08125 [Deltaproteobacteria bacterium]|nr:hypothetical protein [Deltaproteobacteria bacterium]
MKKTALLLTVFAIFCIVLYGLLTRDNTSVETKSSPENTAPSHTTVTDSQQSQAPDLNTDTLRTTIKKQEAVPHKPEQEREKEKITETGTDEPPEEVINPTDPVSEEEAAKLSQKDIGGFSPSLYYETKTQLELIMQQEPTKEEIIDYLNDINNRINNANKELSENQELLKSYHTQGNFEAMEKLQNEIYNKHVLEQSPEEETLSPEEKQARIKLRQELIEQQLQMVRE